MTKERSEALAGEAVRIECDVTPKYEIVGGQSVLWLYHKAGGNKQANEYEQALVAYIRALAQQSQPAESVGENVPTPERKAENLRLNTISQLEDYANSLCCGDWRALDIHDDDVHDDLANIMRRAAEILKNSPPQQGETSEVSAEKFVDQEYKIAVAYQIVGGLIHVLGLDENADCIRALDYMAGMEIDGDILPWPRSPLTTASTPSTVTSDAIDEALTSDKTVQACCVELFDLKSNIVRIEGSKKGAVTTETLVRAVLKAAKPFLQAALEQSKRKGG